MGRIIGLLLVTFPAGAFAACDWRGYRSVDSTLPSPTDEEIITIYIDLVLSFSYLRVYNIS